MHHLFIHSFIHCKLICMFPLTLLSSVCLACLVKGIVHPKVKLMSLITQPHVSCSKSIRPSFIFGTQIKIFLDEIQHNMKRKQARVS